MIERTKIVRMTFGVDEETGQPYTKEELLKPLTDQEIIDIAYEYDGISDLVRFARIILRKAQEK